MTRYLNFFLIAMLISIFSIPAYAASLPSSMTVGDQTLQLNGSGNRKKLFIKLYKAGLYLLQPSSNAQMVVEADEAMAIKLKIVSGLITAEKMEKATLEGFKNATGGNLASIAGEIDQFVSVFRQGIKDGDLYDLSYTPDTGTIVSKNQKVQTTIAGLAFKQALFGIWLSDKPAQESLKKKMLGK